MKPEPCLLNYSDFHKKLVSSPVIFNELPVGHYISLPLPTKRWKQPGYAFFANPAIFLPDKSRRFSIPDRWWLMNAYTGHLVFYSLYSIMPFSNELNWQETIVPFEYMSIQDAKSKLATIELLMDTLVSAFFTSEVVSVNTRQSLLTTLLSYFPQPLANQYRAVAADFFDWLEK